MTTSTPLPAIPHVSRELTARIVQAYGISPVEARRWFRRTSPELGWRSPADLAFTIEGTRELVRFLAAKANERGCR